jgi:hypothetical protein
MSDLSLDLKGQTQKVLKKANLLKWGLGALTALVLAPVIWTLVYAVAGIAALGIITTVVATAALTAINLYPVFTMKLANYKIEKIKEEAKRKPIETMENQFREKKEILEVVKQKIEKFAVKVGAYDGQLETFKQQFPSDAQSFQDISDKMRQLLDARRIKWRESRDKLNQFGSEIQKFSAIWAMTLASSDLKEAAGDLDDTFLMKIQRESAIGAVRDGLASSLAELDTLMMEEVDMTPPALAHDPSPTFNAVPIVDVVPVRKD